MTIANLQTFIRYLTGTDSTSLTDANLLIFINQEYERIVGKLISETAGAIWQFGDSNYTAFPTYTFDLTAGTRAYDIDTSLTGVLTIMGVEILNSSSDYYLIHPISLREIHELNISQSEFFETSGSPLYYEKRENQLVLYPAPAAANVTLTAGCRIFFLRTADIYTAAQVTTGSKVPGFPSPWHDAIGYAVAYIVAIANDMPRANKLLQLALLKEKELLDFISRRDQDNRKIMTNKKIKYI